MSVGKIKHLISRTLKMRTVGGYLLATCLLIGGMVSILGTGKTATAAPSAQLNFQARLLTASGAPVPDGFYNIQFKLYTAATGGVAIWTEDWIDTNGVTAGNDRRVRVTDGYLSVALATYTAFPSADWGSQHFITMNVGGTTQTATPTYDGEMLNLSSERMQLTAVPYAFAAANVGSGDTNAASTDTNDVTISTGDALGATSNSGDILIDSGSATGTAGVINLGSTNASAINIGRSGITTTLQGNVSITGGTDYGVYYRDGSDNVVTTAAGSSGDCFRATTGAAPSWGSCSGTGDVIQGGNSFGTTMTIGTNDTFNLAFETDGTTRLTIDTNGDATLTGELTVSGTGTSVIGGDLRVDGGDITTAAGDLTIAPAGADTFITGDLDVSATITAGAADEFTAGTSGIDYFGASTSALRVGYQSGIPLVGVDTNTGGGTNATVYLSSSAADVGTTTKDSTILELTGSYYNGSAQFNTFKVQNDITGTTSADYKLSIKNNANTEVLALSGAGDLSVNGTGTSTFAGNLSIQGNTTLGNANSDTITFTGRVNSNVEPSANDTYNLGSSALIWNDIYADRICFDGNVDCVTSSAALNVSGWTDGGTVVALTTGTDDVTVGSTSNLGKLAVDGDSDEIQLLVQGNATQTSDLFVVETSGGTDIFSVDTNGATIITPTGGVGLLLDTPVTGSTGLRLNGPSGYAGGNYIEVAQTSIGYNLFQVDYQGRVNIRPVSDTGSTFVISDASGSNSVFSVDTSTGVVATSGSFSAASGLYADNLTLNTGSGVTYTTPGGASVSSKINIVNEPGGVGSNNQVVAMGINSSSASTARVLSLFDQRAGAHQPTLAVFSPDENDAIGFSWEGSNSTAYMKTLGDNIGLRINTTDIITMTSSSISLVQDATASGNFAVNGNATLGNAVTDNITMSGAIQGTNALIFDGSTDDTNEITLAITDPGADFTITLPAETGTICTTAAAGACSTAGSGYVQLAPASAQTDATANAAININKSGNANLAILDNSNASANGVSIDIQSSSSSQYAFQVTSNNGATNGLSVLGNGYVGVGTGSPTRPLHVSGAAPNIADGSTAFVSGSMTSTTNNQAGLRVETDAAPGSASTQFYSAVNFTTTSSSSNLTGAQVAGLYGGTYYSGSGTVGTSMGGLLQVQNVGTGTISSAQGLAISNPTNSGGGTITNNYGIMVNAQTAGTNDYGIAIQAADTQTLWISQNADNTTAAAGIAFGSSRDTNLYRSAADTLMTDDSLTVGANLSINGNTTIGNASGDTLTVNAGTATIANDLAVTLSGGVNGLNFDSDTLSIDAANNRVGIGTAAPSYPLDVVYAGAGQARFQSTGANNSLVVIDNAGAGNKSVVVLQDGGTNKFEITKQTDNTFGIYDNANSKDFLRTTSGGDLLLQPVSGNVGIGNLTPAYKLDVAGSVSGSDTLAKYTATLTSATGSPSNMWLSTSITPSATGATNYYYGQYMGTNGTNANFDATDRIFGIHNQVGFNDGITDTIQEITGMRTDLTVGDQLTVTDVVGYIAYPREIDGTVTNVTGYYASNSLGTGTPTNQYGLFIEDMTDATNDYGIAIQGADTQALWIGSGADNTDAANGIAFGSSRDTNLYRSAADTLMTDDSLTVGTNLVVNGNITVGNATSDTITFTGRVASTINPSANDTYDLGSAALIWNDVYVDRICFDGNTDCATTSAALNTSGFTDDGTVVRLTTSTDNVTIGNTGDLSAALAVDGNADEIQLLVQANATQTSTNLAVFETSGGTDLVTISGAGNTAISTTVADTSEAASLRVTSTATSITNEQNGIYASLTAAPASGTPSRTYNAIEGQVQTSGATSVNSNLYALFGQATLTGSSANTANIAGGYLYAQNQASVAAANMYGLLTSVQNISTGSITTAYGINVQGNTAGSGTIGTNYGVFVTAQTAGTNDYGIAIQAADTQTLWVSQNADNTSVAAGIGFGSSRDTVLYRSAANTLSTGAINVGSNAISGSTVALTVSNGTSTGNVATFNDNATLVASIADGGAATFRNSTNSTAGFSIQNSSSQALLAADTTNTALNLFSGTGGDISPWTTDTAITDGNGGTTDTRDNATAVYYNGYVYMIGGDQGGSGLTTVYYTKVNPGGSLQTPWTNQTATGLTARTYATALAVNGYIYLIGGSTNGTNGSLIVEYAKVNADGSLGTFTATTSLGAIRKEAYAVTYNGYIYVVGGNSSNTGTASAVNTVYYGKVNGDGTISSWTTNSNNLPASRRQMQVIVANGYLQAFGGIDSAGARYDSIYYGKINSDGSVAAFSTQAGSIPSVNGGGGAGIVAMNGYVYLYGGVMSSTDDEVAWAPLSATGGVGSWTNAAAADKLPAARATFGHFAANGYMYAIGGWTGSTQTTSVYYTSAARLKVGASLDLVGYGNGNLTEGSNGGMLTAGNTKIVGTLDVQDSSNFWKSVYMGSDLVVNGYLTHKNTTNSTTAFQVQSASSTTPIFNVDTTNSRVGINTAAPTADLSFGGDSARTINLVTRSSNAAGSALSITAGAAGAGATGFAGGQLTLQGGAAAGTSGNANGGNVYLTGGAGVNSGARGLVVIDTAAVTTTATDATCGATTAISCTLAVATINNTSAVTIGASASSLVISMPDPTITTAGRIFYFTAVDNSSDFTLRLNAGGTQIDISMRENTTATLVWNGSDWTAAGASSSTDLQAAYNNTLTSAGGAELVLNASGGAADGLTVRNNATSPIFGGLLEVQTSIGSNLFTVNNNATEYANNGGAETSTFTMWAGAPAGGSVSRYTTAGNNIATGSASTFVDTTSTANTGVKNTLTSALTANLKYKVSYAVRHTSSTISFTTLDTIFSSDGTSTTATCASGSTATYNTWTRIDCTFTATSVGASNAIIIRHSDSVEHDFYIDNLSVTVSADVNHAADGSVDSALGSNWTAYDADGGAGTTTPTRDTSNIYDTSGAVAVATAGPAANLGVRNNMSITPSVSTQYLVTFYAKLASGSFTDITVGFLPAGGNSTPVSAQLCTDYNTQTLSTSAWTKITCIFSTPSSGISDPDVVVYQPTSGARTFYVDAFTVTLNTNNSSNVQIGGGNKGGPTTLFTLDRSYGAPIADNNNAYLGSMYYDMSTGRIQCYEADGWGACGAAPDNYVNLNPEYSGAVLNGTGVGTMTADLCSNDAALSKNSTLCSTGQARNFYKWTSPQASDQTYSIYVTYQLPTTFNGFSSDDTIQLTARTDSTTNASVTYEMYKSTGSAVTQCGTGETTVVTSANTWQTVGINGNEATGCSFTSSSAGNFVIFKINMMAKNNANAYVSTLSFTTTGR